MRPSAEWSRSLVCEKLGCRSGGRNVTVTPSGRRTGRNRLLPVLSDRTGQIPGQQCRHQNWYQGVKDADTDISHISYQTLLTQICNECFTALFFLRTCIMCYSYYCYSLNWVMFCSGLILIISNQAEQYNSYLEPTYICSKNKSLGVEVEKNQRRNVTIILRFFTWVFSSSGTLCFHFSTFSYLLI